MSQLEDVKNQKLGEEEGNANEVEVPNQGRYSKRSMKKRETGQALIKFVGVYDNGKLALLLQSSSIM